MTNPPFLHDSYREQPDLRCCGNCRHNITHSDKDLCRQFRGVDGNPLPISPTAVCDLYKHWDMDDSDAPDPLLTAIEQGEDDVLHGREATWQEVFGGSDD